MAMPMIQGMETEYKPWGGLAGIMTGEREGLQHFANLQGMEGAQLENVLKQVEASRAANDFANPEMEALRQAGIMGQNRQQDALGRLKQGTLNSDIRAGNQKNETGILDDQLKSFGQELDLAMAALQSGTYGSATLQQVLQNASPQMRQVAQMVGPENLPKVLPILQQKLKEQLMNTPKYMGENNQKLMQHGLDVARDSAKEQQHFENQKKLEAIKASYEKEVEGIKGSNSEKTRSFEQLSAYYLQKYMTTGEEIYKAAAEDANKRALALKVEPKLAETESEKAFAARLAGKNPPQPKSPVTQGQPNVIKLD